uniref:Kinesin-like protein KIF21B n=1 Tax=Cacopsylla melanoneura TaxID=428564 RepID=A0A8D8UHF4_9HEMI
MAEESSVRVAVRIRPQSAREVIDMCRICTSVTPGEPQVTLGADKAFTFDYVFDTKDVQTTIYELCAASLVAGSLEGYNATILAYGQTGSGKTYTMGTGFETDVSEEMLGIIPRAIIHLFEGIQNIQEQTKEKGDTPPDVMVQAQFLELYNEEIIDLFDDTRDYALGKIGKSNIKIHEDSGHSIYVTGATSKLIRSSTEAMNALRQGALSRTTASTQMNSQSSRSHAIFTLHIQQKRLVKVELDQDQNIQESEPTPNKEFETLTAKFHFVDLAGSERLKRTGATGDRAKEGISINCGLLALGNVISALGDRSKRAIHIPYRDSKLTRLLQDSLGGNSRTVMIACVSPSDRDFMESLNTLKYANRARNIQNKIRLNQDKSSKTIMALRAEIQQLQLELLEYKQGKRVLGEDGEEQVNDMYHENIMLQTEINNLRTRTKAMQETIDDLTRKNSQLLAFKASAGVLANGSGDGEGDNAADDCCVKEIITGYCGEIEDLRSKLLISEHTNTQLRKSLSRIAPPSNIPNTGGLMHSPSRVDDLYSVNTDLIAQAKEEVARNLNTLAQKKRQMSETEDAEDRASVDSAYNAELANLTTEIDIKQKLIEELEKSDRRMQGIKQHYEDKFQQLQAKIRSTEEERDSVLTSLSNQKNQPTDKVRKIREDYQHKINMMEKEMRNLSPALKHYQKLLRTQGSYENQMTRLKSEVAEMRQTRVRLIRKMKEETNKHKEQEIQRNREIAKLKKDSRRAQNLIKNLESDKRTKEVILKRKQEEVNMLRKQSRARNPSAMVLAGAKAKGTIGVSPKAAKIKWKNLEKNITSNTMNKQSVISLERDLEKLVVERQEKSHELQSKLKKLDDYRIKYPREKDFHKDQEDEIETLRANLDYINDSITEVQRNIIQVEDTKETLESGDLVSGLKTMPEVSYIIEKLYNMSINQSLIAAQRDTVIRELEAKLSHTEKEFKLQRELLNSLYGSRDQDNNNLSNSMTQSMTQSMQSSNDGGSSASSSPTPADSINSNNIMNTTFVLSANSTALNTTFDKGKRKTGLPRDFDEATSGRLISGGTSDYMDRLQMPPPNQNLMTRLSQYTNSGGPLSLKSLKDPTPSATSSPTLPRRTATSIDFTSTSASSSPRLQRRGTFVLTPNQSNLTHYKPGSMDHGLEMGASPPASPPTYRRSVSREEQSSQNVFSRLTVGSIPPTEPVNSKGTIVPYQGKMIPRAPLVCTHVCQGHLRPVLSVDATDDLLFSASKDKSVRVWDLCEGKQLHSLGRHSHHATCVKYDRVNQLIYSVCASYVKVWDMRTSNVVCVQTLCSSGQSLSASSSLSSQIAQTESPINDIALGSSGRVLYMATGERVKIWDVRQNRVYGTLSGGHQAPIMCMIVNGNGPAGQDLVVTGSKDHYIKVFDVSTDVEDCSSTSPNMNLEPPHYDGIQSLALRDNVLFSGSRDYVIKKWDLNRQELITSQSNAHKNWVCGLSYVPNQPLLLSACRSGTIKLWSTEQFTQLGEMKAHNDSVNCITTNNDLVFTGSNGTSNNMYIWKLNSRLDNSSSDSNS